MHFTKCCFCFLVWLKSEEIKSFWAENVSAWSSMTSLNNRADSHHISGDKREVSGVVDPPYMFVLWCAGVCQILPSLLPSLLQFSADSALLARMFVTFKLQKMWLFCTFIFLCIWSILVKVECILDARWGGLGFGVMFDGVESCRQVCCSPGGGRG